MIELMFRIGSSTFKKNPERITDWKWNDFDEY